jgi:long-subunit acyl-CoA synthetase (AMP-forming)
MTDSDISAAEASTGSKTIADLLPLAARKHGPKQAVLYNDGSAWVGKTFAQVGETVRDLSLGLVALGIEKGDKVAILANTRKSVSTSSRTPTREPSWWRTPTSWPRSSR